MRRSTKQSNLYEREGRSATRRSIARSGARRSGSARSGATHSRSLRASAGRGGAHRSAQHGGGVCTGSTYAHSPSDGGVPSNTASKRRRRTTSKPRLFFGIVMLIVGLGILLYPLASEFRSQIQTNDILEELYEDEVASSNLGSATDSEKATSSTYQQLLAYNELVRTGEAGDINDPFGFSSSDLADWGLPDGIVGQIDIPAMGVSLPLYLGATSENMSQGAAVVAGTSVPLGETDSNCVIAAHRGLWAGLSMFRDIEKLEIGDFITITTPWDTLVYAVVSTEVVTPDDVEAVGVQEGRDLITLLTCHPYGYNSYRMLVFCERVDTEPEYITLSQSLVTQLTPDLSSSSLLLVFENVLRLVGFGILVVLGATLVVQAVKDRRQDGGQGGRQKRLRQGAYSQRD